VGKGEDLPSYVGSDASKGSVTMKADLFVVVWCRLVSGIPKMKCVSYGYIVNFWG
jgi:hypothetical protein